MRIILILFTAFLFCGFDIQSEKGLIKGVKEGDVLKPNSMFSGQIDCKGEGGVTFKSWNFSRSVPHTEVFVNCTDLTFVNGNLNNVELQEDFIIDGALTIHQEEKIIDGKLHKVVECGDNKTRTYRIDTIDIDVIADRFPEMSKAEQATIKEAYEKEGKTTNATAKIDTLISTEDTPNDKKIIASILR